MIWRGFGAWQNGDKHVTNWIEMWQFFLTHARNRTTTRFVKVGVLSQFCPRCDKFCHNSLIHQSICHISYRNGDFVMTNFVLSLSHLICVMINFVQFLSSVCHILYVLWQNLSNFCHIFTNFVQFLSHFLDFYTFFMHKMYILVFCPIFVTFFVTWDKFCHFFDTSETQ